MHKTAIFFTKLVLKLSLFFGLLLLGLLLIFGTSDQIKESLKVTNSYEQVVDASINTAKVQSPLLATVTLTNPQIEQIVRKNITGEVLQTKTEGLIDNLYLWLDGTVQEPELAIDISNQKQQIAVDIGAYAGDRLRALPVCAKPPANRDILTVTCRQPGLNIQSIQNEVTQTLINDSQFLPDTNLNLNELVVQSAGQPITEKYSEAPKYFQLLKILPFVLLGVFLITSLILIYISKSRRKAIRTVGWSLFGNGVFIIIAPLIYNLFAPSPVRTAPSGSSVDITPVAVSIIQQIYQDLTSIYLLIGGISLGVGTIVLVSVFVYGRLRPIEPIKPLVG